MVYLLTSFGFWRMVVSFPMRYRGMLKMDASGPSAFSISFKFLMSVWLIAPINGAVTR